MGASQSAACAPAPKPPADNDASQQQARSKEAAEAEAKRAEAEVHRAEALSHGARTGAPLLLGAAALAALVADVYAHESSSHIRRSVLRSLRACRVPPSAALPKGASLPLPLAARPPALALGRLPTLVVGPSGCGKTSLLSAAAREAAAPSAPGAVAAPVVLVRVRAALSHASPAMGAAAQSPDAGAEVTAAHARMDATAAAVLAQLPGYPTRRALLVNVLSRGIVLRGTVEAKISAPSSARLAAALRLLFDASDALCRERAARHDISAADAPPVLLFDDVEDLIRDADLARAGGRFVFEELASLITAYCVDRRTVRAAVAGSGGALAEALDDTAAGGMRWVVRELRDPSEAAAHAALQARGIAHADATRIVAACGARLRLLEEPLQCSDDVDGEVGGIDAFLEGAAAGATRHVRTLLERTPDVNAAASLLDAVLRKDDDPSLPSSAPMLYDAPAAWRSGSGAHAARTVLYVAPDLQLSFQTRLHAAAWRRERAGKGS